MSGNNDIKRFLGETEAKNFDQFEMLNRLREIVLAVFPNVSETFKYGGILFSLREEFGGLFVYKNHISFEFSYGYKLISKLKLEGGGKYRRHLKFYALDDISEESIKDLLRQINEIHKN